MIIFTNRINRLITPFFLFIVLILINTQVQKLECLKLFDENNQPKFELNHEKRLINHLLNNYQVKYGRPVVNRTENIVVRFEVYLVQLIDLDERNQVLATNMETQYEWWDSGLKWDESLYGGIDNVRLPVNQIWTPDIVLYNYADTRLEEKREVMAIINSNGKVRWRPSCIYKSTCQINIQNFPYDHQNCRMKFGSWTYDGDSIDIQFMDKPEINQELFLKSNQWELISTSGVRNIKKYECCKEYFPDITYQIKMRRKGGFYNYILVLPCILLSVLTMVLFWLPPESPAKMLLGMNIFTSFFVMLLLLSKNVPSATDKIPLIGAYYCLNMVMIATSTCACTVVVHIYFRGNGKVPYILRKIFLQFLARILCMVLPPQPRPRERPIEVDSSRADLYNTLVTSSNLNKMSSFNRASMSTLHESNKAQKQQVYESRTSLNSDGERVQSLIKIQHNPNELEAKTNSIPRQSLRYSTAALNPGPSYSIQEPRQNSLIEPEFYRQTSVPNTHHRQRSSCKFGRQPFKTASQEQVLAHNKNERLNHELNFSFNVIENDIKEIRDYLRHTRKKIDIKDLTNKNTDEWKRLALILDRLLFFTYIIVIIVSMTLLFPR